MKAVALCGLMMLLAGCGAREASPAMLGPDEQFERGMEAVEAGRDSRAIQFLERFVQDQVADPRIPEARYHIGHAYLNRREYISAADAFQRLASDFPTHELSVEGRFRVCDAYYRLSPRPQRDQQYTQAGVAHCESVTNGYPDSEWAEPAERYRVEMRETLAQKDYQTGVHYQRRRAYDAAVIYFQRTVEQYPDTTVAPTALLRMVEAYETMQYEREAEETRERLLEEYPDSPEAAELRG